MKKFIVILLPCFLTGCIQTWILDEIQLIQSIGYDYIDDEQIEGTISIPMYEIEGVVEGESISAISTTSRDIRFQLNMKSAKPLHSGKITSILFNEELARNVGLINILDTYSREPTIATRNYLAIVNDRAKKLLNADFPLEVEVALYIQKMLEQTMEMHNLPKSNFHTFLKAYYEEGQDPILPYLIQDENAVQVGGVALFKGDRYIATLNLDQMFILKVLLEHYSQGMYEIELPEQGEFVALRNVDSKAKYHIERNTNTPVIAITILFTGKIREYTGESLTADKLAQIKQLVKENLEHEAIDVISLFQELKIDPLGLGSRLRSINRNYNQAEWETYYEQAIIQVKADIEITEIGIKNKNNQT